MPEPHSPSPIDATIEGRPISAPSNVALFFFRLGNASGGAERMIIALANALAKRGHTVSLVSWDEPDAEAFYPINGEVRWMRLGFRPGLRDKIRRLHALTSVLRKAPVQVLIGFVVSGDKTIFAAAKLADVRLVVAERNAPSMYRLRYGALQRFIVFACLHLADRITVQLPSFPHRYPATVRDRISVIGNPVMAASMLATPSQPNEVGRNLLLAVGRLDPIQKGFEILVRAFARIAPAMPDWDLEIIGEGPQQKQLELLGEELSLGHRLRFIPQTREIMRRYAEAQLFAIPSRWEGFSNALAEALSHGLPAVGFGSAEGVADLICSDCGWLADGIDDVESFAGALQLAMSSPNERAERGANAVLRMKQYAPDRQFDLWEQLLSSFRSEESA